MSEHDDTTLGDDLRRFRDGGLDVLHVDGFAAVAVPITWLDQFAARADALTAALREARVALAQVDPVTVSMNSALTVRAERAEAEVERLHTWDGLMSLLNEHWPEDIFATDPDCEDRDSGVRLVSAVRRADRAEAERDRLATQVESVRALADRLIFERSMAAGQVIHAALDAGEERP